MPEFHATLRIVSDKQAPEITGALNQIIVTGQYELQSNPDYGMEVEVIEVHLQHPNENAHREDQCQN